MIDLATRQKLVSQFPCFSKLTEEESLDLAKLMEEIEFDQDEVIVKEGDAVDSVYLIVTGSAEVVHDVLQNGVAERLIVATLGTGESIGLGEMGFFSQTGLRTATVVAKTKMQLLRLSIDTFHHLLNRYPNLSKGFEQGAKQMVHMQLVKKIAPFTKLSQDTVLWLSKQIKECVFEPGEIIFSQGDQGDFCYFIGSGKVDIFTTNEKGHEQHLAQLEQSALFGEVALLTSMPRSASARAVDFCELIALSKDDFIKLKYGEDEFSTAVNFTMFERARPVINKRVIMSHQRSPEGEMLVTLNNTTQQTYYQLTKEGWFVYQQLNSKKNLPQIVGLFQKEFENADPNFVYNLVVDLIKGGFAFYTGEEEITVPRMTVVTYDPKGFSETSSSRFEDCFPLRKKSKITWVHVEGLSDANLIQQVASHYKLHPLTVRDIFDVNNRSKVEEFEEYVFVSLKTLWWNGEHHKFNIEQVSLVLGKNFVISFQESDKTSLYGVMKDQLHTKPGQRVFEQGADYLLYRLVDLAVDHYFSILEIMGEKIEELEEVILSAPEQRHAHSIYELKRQIFVLRKTVWPVRETVSHLHQVGGELIGDFTKSYLKDLYDHIAQAIDTVGIYRDLVAGMFDLYLSSLSNRTNEVMKVLTIIATIFIPITSIGTILGMNFDNLTLYHWYWGYPVAVAFMLLLAACMILFFKRKKWI